MSRLVQSIEDVMAAVGFAEAGEFEYAREMAGGNGTCHKRLLLAVEGPYPAEEAFLYAKSLCGRTDSLVEILYCLSPDSALLKRWNASTNKGDTTRAFLAEALERLNALLLALVMDEVTSRVAFRMGALDKEVPLYLDRSKGITLVMVEPLDRKGCCRPGLEEELSQECNRRGCPLVVMAAKRPASLDEKGGEAVKRELADTRIT